MANKCAQVGLTRFLVEYATPRAHTSVVSEFLELAQHATYASRIGGSVTEPEEVEDKQVTYEVVTELLFKPSQVPLKRESPGVSCE